MEGFDFLGTSLLLDYPSQSYGQICVEDRIGAAFRFISVEPTLGQLALDDASHLPTKIKSITHACLHASACPRGHQVSSITSQEDTILAPCVGHAYVVFVERVLVNLDIVFRNAQGIEQWPDLCAGWVVGRCLAWRERNFPAVIASRERDIYHRTVLVGPEGEEVTVRPPALDAAVDDHPCHVIGVPQQIYPEHPTARAGAPVGGNRVACSHGAQLASCLVAAGQRYAFSILLHSDDFRTVADL